MIFSQAEENYYVNRGLSALPTDEIKKLKLEGNIVLGDFVFNTIDERGVVWVITDIDGWWDSPGVDIPTVERSAGDGGYDARGRYTSRKLTLKGTFLVPKPELVEEAKEKLLAAGNLVYEGAWLKTGTGPTYASYVFLQDSIRVSTRNTRGKTEFEISLRASDPIKYEWNDADPDGYLVAEIPVKNSATNLEGARTITNKGNYPVPIFFEISGPLVAPATIFNRRNNQLIIITQGLRGVVARRVVNKKLDFELATFKDIATLTTTEKHDFRAGDSVFVSGAGSPFDGDQIITSLPTDTTFTFETSAALISAAAYKSLTANSALLETALPHGLEVGQEIIVNGVDLTFDGTHVISSIPNSKSLTFAKTRSSVRNLSSAVLVGNIATISTTDNHEFILGEDITISGAGINYDGVFEIIGIPSATSFSYAVSRTNARAISQRSMSNDIVTIRTASPHGFVANEGVNVGGINLSLDGGYRIASVTADTFTYRRPRFTERRVVVKALNAGVATLTTSEAHGYSVNERVTVENVDETFNGTYTITTVPSINTFTYAKAGSPNVTSVSVPDGRVRIQRRKVFSAELIGGVATITTDVAHGAIFGESVTISGSNTVFDGTYTITGIPFLNTFTFARSGANVPAALVVPITKFSRTSNVVTIDTDSAHGIAVGQSVKIANLTVELNGIYVVTAVPSATRLRFTKNGENIAEAESQEATATLDYGFASFSGEIAEDVVEGAFAQVGGSLPFAATTGVATVSSDVSRQQTGGSIIKTNNVIFTPGLQGATAVSDADILEIDTKKREVAFNGEPDGARGRVDVLADFIQLEPGENQLEFEDGGNPEGEAVLRVYYRSGWIG
jgi:hypothetical protein